MSLILKDEEHLFTDTDVYLGDVVTGVDGFYYFWPDHSRCGAWDEGMLLEVAEYLRVKNKPWQDQIDNDPKISGDQNP